MGNLIVMSKALEAPLARFEDGHSAEILFFTGVRYYRMTEEVVAKPVQRRRRPTKARKVSEPRVECQA